jgi:hypothetical protein
MRLLLVWIGTDAGGFFQRLFGGFDALEPEVIFVLNGDFNQVFALEFTSEQTLG